MKGRTRSKQQLGCVGGGVRSSPRLAARRADVALIDDLEEIVRQQSKEIAALVQELGSCRAVTRKDHRIIEQLQNALQSSDESVIELQARLGELSQAPAPTEDRTGLAREVIQVLVEGVDQLKGEVEVLRAQMSSLQRRAPAPMSEPTAEQVQQTRKEARQLLAALLEQPRSGGSLAEFTDRFTELSFGLGDSGRRR